MAPDSTCSMSASCSASFRDCTARRNSRAPVLGSQSSIESWPGTAGVCGRKASLMRAPPSISVCQQRRKLMSDHLESVNILLVEDNPADAELCIRALRKHNLANELVWVKD